MNSIQRDMEEFHRQLRNGAVQRAYRALISYMMELRTHFQNKYPDFSVSALYQGYMDMTFFAIFTPSLKKSDLKIAIVFNYEAFRFEAWLAGKNRKVNQQYWGLLKDRKWPSCRVMKPAKGVDSIIERDLVREFNLNDTDALTTSIETGLIAFIKDMEKIILNIKNFR